MSNLDGWNRDGHSYPAVDAAVLKFETDLRARFAEVDGVQEALIQQARALYGAIMLTQHKMLAPHSHMKRTGPLYEVLPNLSGNFLRVLRALGVITPEVVDPNAPPPPGASPEALRAWSKAYVERVTSTATAAAAGGSSS
jgi:hypothetical protein